MRLRYYSLRTEGKRAARRPQKFMVLTLTSWRNLSLLSGTAAVSTSVDPETGFADFNSDGIHRYVFRTAWAQQNQPTFPSLYMNNGMAQGNPNHWLEAKLVGTTSNRDAVGAHPLAKIGEAELQRWVFNTGFQGNSALIQDFGLGNANQVDKLVIKWPSGNKQTLKNVQGGQRITITE
jgi:hypothetical protein